MFTPVIDRRKQAGKVNTLPDSSGPKSYIPAISPPTKNGLQPLQPIANVMENPPPPV